MNVFIKILIGCVMIKMTGSCVESKVENLRIDWDSVELPKDQNGVAHQGLAGPVVGTIGDCVIIGGGANFPEGMPWEGGRKQYHTSFYIYKWNGRQLEYQKRDELPFVIGYAASCSWEDSVYFAGGEDEGGPLKTVYRVGLMSDLSLALDTLPDLPFAVSNAALSCVEGTLYLIGGDGEKMTSDRVLKLDIKESNSWQEIGRLPEALSNTVSGVYGTDIYIAGGRRKVEGDISPFSNRLYVFDTKENVVEKRSDMPRALAAAVGMVYGDQFLVFGGDTGDTFHQVEQLIFEAANTVDSSTRSRKIEQKNALQIGHPGFSKQQLVYSMEEDLWKILPIDFPFAMPVTTTAIVLDENTVILPSGEVKAGVRTDNIYIGRLKEQRKKI
ncbi:hypothetical protein M472_04275 [Sphingobacterium paucimobilis HER1398]|uniref:Cyclically-permuted mutarotase family protein n=2 Tax=Sphingobacterium TaxID=28453 RepID=U2HR75_9SPHI|nr:hypothetical protein M472_04275 [Sphingobacterium paucimobilis HER1398]